MYDTFQEGDTTVANEEFYPDNFTSELGPFYNVDYDLSSSYYSSYPGGYLPVTTATHRVPQVLFSIVFLLGIPGNALVCFVLLRNGALRSTTNIYLFNLALVDLIFLLMEIPSKIGVYYVSPGDQSWKLGLGMCKLSIYFMYVNMSVSLITLTAMAINRYCAVMYPISARTHRSMLQTGLIIGTIWVVSLGSQAPTLLVADFYYPKPYSMCMEIWPSIASLRAFKTSLFVFLYCVPLIVITLCYARMAAMLWHSSDFGLASSSSQNSAVGIRRIQSRRKIARLVLVLVVCFAVCWLPYHVKMIQECWVRHTLTGTHALYYWGVFARWLAYCNSCLNPLLYSFLGENFRVYFKKAFNCGQPFRLKSRILVPLEVRLNGFLTQFDDGAATTNVTVSATSRSSRHTSTRF